MVENVLLVVIDALRTDRVGVYNETNLTPNIDNLAMKGEIFEQCYSCINTTDPSLTTILTGQYPTRHGLVHHGGRVSDQEYRYVSGTQSLAERFSESHTTIAVDILERWHQRGFEYYFQEGATDSKDQRQYAQVRDFLAKLVQRLPNSLEQIINLIYSLLFGKKTISQIKGKDVTNTIINEIEKSEEPWFILAHYWDTHIPYNSSSTDSNITNSQVYEENDRQVEDVLETIEGSDWAESLSSGLLGEAKTIGDVKRQYDTAVHRTDQELGRLFKYLNNSNKFDETAIIITADHGESMTEHNIFFDHHGLYEPSIHVPLIIKAPGFNGSETEFVQHFDLAPTILDLVGKEYNSKLFDGTSLVPIPNDARQLDRDAIYAEEARTARRRCIRTDSYKYIMRLDNNDKCRYCDITHSPGDELYDLTSDPAEEENIINQYPEIASQLEEKLSLWVKNLPDPSGNDKTFSENSKVKQRLEDMGYV